MAWVRLSDDFYDNPKLLECTSVARDLWVTGIAYCNRNLTDGFIPRRVAHRLIDTDGVYVEVGGDVVPATPRQAAGELLAAGLWQEVDGGYAVHDYLEYQDSAEKIRGERRKTADRVRKWREAQRTARSGVGNGVTGADPVTEPDERSDAAHNGSCNAVTNADVTPAPTPTPPPTPNPSLLTTTYTSPEENPRESVVVMAIDPDLPAALAEIVVEHHPAARSATALLDVCQGLADAGWDPATFRKALAPCQWNGAGPGAVIKTLRGFGPPTPEKPTKAPCPDPACVGGWLGENADGQLIPCLHCKAHRAAAEAVSA